MASFPEEEAVALRKASWTLDSKMWFGRYLTSHDKRLAEFQPIQVGNTKIHWPSLTLFFYNWVATTRYTGGLFLDLRIFSCKFGRDETNIIQRVSWTRLWWGCSTSFEVSMHISETTQNKFLWERVFGHAQITRHKDLKKTCRTRKRVLPSIVSRG